MNSPLMFDLCCGLGGATEGFLAEGWDCIGIDIERHQYGNHRYPAQLWIQDLLTISGSQLRNAKFLWASVPCQFFSYTSMPWTKAKELAVKTRNDPILLEKEIALFNACFRIQREASEASGRHIPLIVENVRGAQPWVGRARGSFGSFFLWGDVPALMPVVSRAVKVPGFRFDGSGKSFQSASVKRSSRCDCQHPEKTPSGFASISVDCPIHGDADDGPTITTVFPSSLDATKVPTLGGGRRTDPGKGARFTTRDCGLEAEGVKQRGSGAAWFDEALNERRRNATAEARKVGGDWFGVGNDRSPMRQHSSKSSARKMASAMIAKIPESLSRHIARTFYPHNQ